MRWVRWAALAGVAAVLAACVGGGPSSAPAGYYTVRVGPAATIDVPDAWLPVRADALPAGVTMQMRGPGDVLLVGVARQVTTNDVGALLGDQQTARVADLPGYQEVDGPSPITVFDGEGRRVDFTYDAPARDVSGRGVDLVTVGPDDQGVLLSVTATDAAYDETEFDTIANSIRYVGAPAQ